MSVFVLLLVTALGVAFTATTRTRFPQDGAVLGEAVESMHLDMLIKFDGREIRYSTDAQKPGASIADLLNEYGQQGGVLLGYRREGDEDRITVVETFLSNESENATWHMYVNGSEYRGKFNERILLDQDEILIRYE